MFTINNTMPLKIQSSARIASEYVHTILFGEQEVGKTMTIPTAPKPLWLLTEPTRKESLTVENIVKVYDRPSKEDIAEWVKSHKKLKGKELEAAVADPETEIEMTGITYDVPRIDIPDYQSFTQAVDFLKGPEGKKFQTVFVDSASAANKIVLEHYQNQKTKSGNKADGRRAYGQTADEVYTWFEDLIRLPNNTVFICHASEFQHNIGTREEPIWQRELFPTFHGNKLKREAHHLAPNIFQVIKGRRLPDGSMLYKEDDGSSIRTLKIRPDTPQGVERTLCPRLLDQEPTNLTALFNKIKGTKM